MTSCKSRWVKHHDGDGEEVVEGASQALGEAPGPQGFPAFPPPPLTAVSHAGQGSLFMFSTQSARSEQPQCPVHPERTDLAQPRASGRPGPADSAAPMPCLFRGRGTATARLSAVLVRLFCSANVQPSAGSGVPFLGEWMELGSA